MVAFFYIYFLVHIGYNCYMKNIELIESCLINDDNLSLLTDKKLNCYNLSKLLGCKLSQSQSIRFGKVFERFIKNILSSKGIIVIDETIFDIYETNSTTIKNKKDVDLLFILNDILYYFEIKTSLFLDSEKSKQTDIKITDITSYFVNRLNEYACKSIISGCLTCWFEYEPNMKKTIKSNVYYMKDLFNLIDVDISRNEYYDVMKKLGEHIN